LIQSARARADLAAAAASAADSSDSALHASSALRSSLSSRSRAVVPSDALDLAFSKSLWRSSINASSSLMRALRAASSRSSAAVASNAANLAVSDAFWRSCIDASRSRIRPSCVLSSRSSAAVSFVAPCNKASSSVIRASRSATVAIKDMLLFSISRLLSASFAAKAAALALRKDSI